MSRPADNGVDELREAVRAFLEKKSSNDSVNNYFDVSLNPSLVALSFKGVSPSLDGDTIVVEMSWLFEREKAVFVKVK